MFCWNCLKDTISLAPDLGKGWYKCAACGATRVDEWKRHSHKKKVKV